VNKSRGRSLISMTTRVALISSKPNWGYWICWM